MTEEKLGNAAGIPTSTKSMEEMFATFDADGSGNLCFAEFKVLSRPCPMCCTWLCASHNLMFGVDRN